MKPVNNQYYEIGEHTCNQYPNEICIPCCEKTLKVKITKKHILLIKGKMSIIKALWNAEVLIYEQFTNKESV